MAGDEDIGAQLPRPPLPAPARREAAIEAAMRRFDGEAPSAAPARKSRPGAFAWLSGPGRPYAAALAGTFLVALVALPLAWKPMGDEGRPRGESPPATAKLDNPPEPSAAAAAGVAPGAPPAPADEAQAVARPAEKAAPGVTSAEALAEVVPPPPPPPMMAPPPPPPPPPPAEMVSPSLPVARSEAARQRESRLADNRAADAQSVTVTGARVRRPNLESAAPVTTVAPAETLNDLPYVTGTRHSEPRFRRGDWNACTVDDPTRSLRGCTGLVDTRAKSRSGRSDGGMAGGLALAWRGDFNGAIQAFDGVIAATPRSSFAYLNRGQAKLRKGDLDGALADLDRAVRYAPRSARAYFNRSLAHRMNGDLRRARADEARAAELDERYAPLVQ